MRALKITLNSISVIDIEGDTVGAELKALQKEVGGFIETITLRDSGVMIVDEDGIMKQYPHNDTASYISGHHIYGTALIVGQDDDRFDDVPEQYLVLLRLGE